MPSVAVRSAERSLPKTQDRGVYLDYHASTPCDPRVVEAMLPYLLDTHANPASSVHVAGRAAADAIDVARREVASAIGAEPSEVIFTSGATESNNLAILGTAPGAPSGRTKILASSIEHISVLAPCQTLEERGFSFEVIPVDREGRLDIGALVEMTDEETFLVSVQAVNNEIGTIQPVPEVVQIVHAAGAIAHCDAAQALGRISVDVGAWGADLVSLSGHKCYGPKGVGALYLRGGARGAPIEPLIYGGGQEWCLRPGTLNVPGIAGFGAAARIAEEERESDAARALILRDWVEHQILGAIPGASRNGANARRVAGNSSLTLPGLEAEALIARLRGVHVSTGSACASGAPEPSHVLRAIGLDRAQSYGTLRIGIGRYTVAEDVQYAASRIVAAASALAAHNPSVSTVTGLDRRNGSYARDSFVTGGETLVEACLVADQRV